MQAFAGALAVHTCGTAAVHKREGMQLEQHHATQTVSRPYPGAHPRWIQPDAYLHDPVVPRSRT